MEEDKEKAIEVLHQKIEELQRRHKLFHQEIEQLQNAIFELQVKGITLKPSTKVEEKSTVKKEEQLIPKIAETQPKDTASSVIQPSATPRVTPKTSSFKDSKTPWEEFIGTNLLNKIGIAILVIGIGFGAKYSIDHELLSPLTRIILGYIAGIALIILALRLKKSHDNFSAVLLSGGMAVLYFLTYAAYDFYALIPQSITFVLMVVFTAFTVFSATVYNKQVIGIIGLVGAYAVPFLLSDGSGRAFILFAYITIINTGILILAFKKYWKILYYLAFAFTWISFASWFAFAFDASQHVAMSLTFATVYFLIFYTTFLAYKLIRKEPLHKWDVVFMLLNSFIYFTYGYVTIDSIPNGDQYLGLYALFTAVIHFIVCVIVYKQQSAHNDTFYFVAGLVLVFITLAVPIQLEGNWVTLVWAGEAGLLFWIGRTKGYPVYEKLSYPLIILAAVSLFHDWNEYYLSYYYAYEPSYTFTLFFNIQFLTTILVAGALGFVIWLGTKTTFPSPFAPMGTGHQLFTYGLPFLLLLIVYAGCYKEIETYWNYRYALSKVPVQMAEGDYYDQFDYSLQHFKIIWLIIYSAIFALVVAALQMFILKNQRMRYVSLCINACVILSFITGGLLALSELRQSYITQDMAQYFSRSTMHILIRYAGIVVILPLLWFNYIFLRDTENNKQIIYAERIFCHIVILTLLSSELIQWLDLSRIENSYKLALSILWGAYGLFLIVLGLWKDLKYLRIAAIVLFGITLIKLFVYDMENMSTIARTIVMIVLGVLLLTASFLYNKNKHSIKNGQE